MVDNIAKLLPADKSFRFIDLGCGCGHVIYYLARSFPKGHFVGVELSPILWLVSKIVNIFNRNVTIKLGSIFSQDLSTYDFVYIFLSPVGNEKLVKNLQKVKGVIISNSFELQSFPLARKIYGKQPLLVYRSAHQSGIITSDEKINSCQLEDEYDIKADSRVLRRIQSKQLNSADHLPS